jgi:small-conductance mechanosensitive channel
MTRLIEQFFDLFSRMTGIMMEQRFLGALVIMAMFATLAVLANFLIHRVANYIGRKSNVKIGRTVFGGIRRPAWIILLIVGALLSVTWLNLDQPFAFIVKANLKTLLILVIAVGLGRLMKNICHLWWINRGQGIQIIGMFENVGRVTVLVAATALLLLVWKIDISPLLASAGIVGLAVALAAKDTLANLFGGINLFLDKPFVNGGRFKSKDLPRP